jgi:hypothetical protein
MSEKPHREKSSSEEEETMCAESLMFAGFLLQTDSVGHLKMCSELSNKTSLMTL